MIDQVIPHVAQSAMQDPRGALRNVATFAGRMSGMAGDDARALQDSGIPAWFWIVVGGVAGFVGGVYVCSRHADKLPRWLPGRRVP